MSIKNFVSINAICMCVCVCVCVCVCASLVTQTVKNVHVLQEIWVNPWVGKIPGGGHGNPIQYSCLENPMDRGAWRAIVHGVTKSQTQLKRMSTHTQVSNRITLSHKRAKRKMTALRKAYDFPRSLLQSYKKHISESSPTPS